MSVVELEPTTPYGEMEFWLSATESARIRAKGPFFITDFTLVDWSRELCHSSDIIAVTSERDHKTTRELEVRVGQIATTRRLCWPVLLWFKDPSVMFEVVQPNYEGALSRMLLRIHHEAVFP